MKHKIVDGIDVNVEHVHSHELPVDEIDQIIDKVVSGAITIIAVATIGGIIKKLL